MNKILRLTFAGLVTFAATLAPSASFAHTEIVSTNPTPDSVVEAGVIELDMEFAEALLESPDSSGSEVKITSANGDAILVDCVYVEGPNLRAKAVLDTEGEMTLTWRTVGEDGHAISDSFNFSVANTSGFVAGDTANLCEPRTDYAVNGAGEPTAEPLAGAASDNSGLIGLGLGILFVLVFSVIGGIQAKRRQDKDIRANR
ncbi:MAG: hypothetical protein RIT51_398 [Actinomycetota bacterium]